MDLSQLRDVSPCPVGFIGDLADPWVVAIAEGLASVCPVERISCNGPLPDRPFGQDPPSALVIHRHRLSAADAALLSEWRESTNGLHLTLVVSPFTRYEEVERASTVVDAIVSEAIAAEVLPGRLKRRLDGDRRLAATSARPACRVEVASGDPELARMLAEVCTRAGYPTRTIDDRQIGEQRPASTDRVLTVWDVPVLESGWPRRLRARAIQIGPMIALTGFADRETVTRAREAGAFACLELPCELEDLVDAIDRAVLWTPVSAWPIAARAESAHRLPMTHRKPGRRREVAVVSRWSDANPPSTIS